jgi:hypothetical protein
MNKLYFMKNVLWFIGTFFATSVILSLVIACMGGIGGYDFHATLQQAQLSPPTLIISLAIAIVDAVYRSEHE